MRIHSPARCLAAAAALWAAMSCASGAAGDDATSKDIIAEFEAADRQTSEALERAPVRGWGDQSALKAINDLRSRLRQRPKAAAAEADLLGRLPGELAAIQGQYLALLHLEPAATVAVDAAGAATARPGKIELTAWAGVPTAIVLLLVPSPAGGDLAIGAINADGIKVDGQAVRLLRRFGQYVVLPLTASGTPGRRQVALKLTAAGRDSSLPVMMDVRPAGRVIGEIVRKGDSSPLTAKLFVEDEAGRLYAMPGEPDYRTQSWYAPWQPRLSCVQGKFALSLPPGRYRVTAMKGCGWRDWSGTLDVSGDQPVPCRIEMEPLRDLEASGWLCGDMHVHYRGSPSLAQLRAEDVNVVANTLYSSHKPVALPRYAASSDALHLSTSNQEIEHWNFGNVFYFAVPTTVQDPKPGEPEMTPMFHYDEQAHRMGGITLRWLRARPFSAKGGGQQQPELAVSAAVGLMDVWTVLENSMQNLLDDPSKKWNGSGWGGKLYEHTYLTWYALLNCGLRVPAAAGTSYGRLSRLGFNRVYAKVAGPLNEASWAAALKRGDGFVTNGPLLWLRAGEKADVLPGDSVALAAPGEVALSVELISRHPVRLVELLQNGRVIARRQVERPGEGLTWQVKVRVEAPSWFAARCFGEHRPRYFHSAAHNQFAHTNPLVVTVAGRRPASSVDAARFVKEIDALIDFAPNLDEPMRARALALYARARTYFAEMRPQR